MMPTIVTDEELAKSCLDYRAKHFAVEVQQTRGSMAGDPYAPKGECSLGVTHNGSAFQCISLSEEEAKAVVYALATHYKWSMTIEPAPEVTP